MCHLIAGTVAWQAVLRLVALGAVAIAVASPVLAAFTVMALGKVFFDGYVSLVMASRAIGKMYRKNGKAVSRPDVAAESNSRTANGFDSYSTLRDLDESDFSENNGGMRVPEPASATD